MTSEFFGRQRECRFYTAGCGNKMAVSVTGPRAVNELGGQVTPGTQRLRRWADVVFISIIQMFCVYWDNYPPGVVLLVDTAGRYWV